MPVRRHLHLDGLRLSYLEQGSPAAGRPSILLLHGLMGCAETFLPLMEEIGPGQHVLAIDLPGAGQSERRDDIDAGLGANADILHRLIQALELTKPIVVGHSHGGAVALSLAARRPKVLRSLVLVAPAHPYFEEANPLIRFYLTLPGRLFAYSMPWYPQWMQMFCLRRMAGPRSWDTPERLKPYRENLRTPGTMSHLLRLLGSWHQDMYALRRGLRRPLAMPSLLIWGDSDRAVPLHSATELRAHLRRSELVVLPGIGHRPAEETPAQVATLLRQWMGADLALASAPSSPQEPAYAPALSLRSSASHARSAALMTSSFEAGD
jgi:pimeloyl-ACP methyl ester carboxylesterase